MELMQYTLHQIYHTRDSWIGLALRQISLCLLQWPRGWLDEHEHETVYGFVFTFTTPGYQNHVLLADVAPSILLKGSNT